MYSEFPPGRAGPCVTDIVQISGHSVDGLATNTGNTHYVSNTQSNKHHLNVSNTVTVSYSHTGGFSV